MDILFGIFIGLVISEARCMWAFSIWKKSRTCYTITTMDGEIVVYADPKPLRREEGK